MTNETITAPEQTSKPVDGKSELNDGLCVEAMKLYAPPFRYYRGYIFDSRNNAVADDDAQDVAMRIRGWGRISYLPDAEALQDKVGELVAQAMTEFWVMHNVKLRGSPASGRVPLECKVRGYKMENYNFRELFLWFLESYRMPPTTLHPVVKADTDALLEKGLHKSALRNKVH